METQLLVVRLHVFNELNAAPVVMGTAKCSYNC